MTTPRVGRQLARALAEQTEEPDAQAVVGLVHPPRRQQVALERGEGVVVLALLVEDEVRGQDVYGGGSAGAGLEEVREARGRPVELVIAERRRDVAHLVEGPQLDAHRRRQRGVGRAHREVTPVERHDGFARARAASRSRFTSEASRAMPPSVRSSPSDVGL